MKTYISLLRGINVSGHKKIKMADLSDAMKAIGLVELKTYIQSGNLVFNHESISPKIISEKISAKIKDSFTFDVPVLTLETTDWKRVIDNNPFAGHKNIDLYRVAVTFLDELPEKDKLDMLLRYSFEPDEFIVKEKAVYIHCPLSYGNSKLNNNFFEQKLKVAATTRNWKTINKLYEMACGMQTA